MSEALHTVVEMPSFQKFADRNLSADELTDLIDLLAVNPTAGEVMQGTGGVRKVRFATGNQGKRDSVRVVYYYHDDVMPVLLLAGFAKNEKANISPAERTMFKKMLPMLIADYRSNIMANKSIKMGKAARRIMDGLEEAHAWIRGEPVTVRIHHVPAHAVDVKTARKKLKLSQDKFAARFGIPPATLRNWEQGRRTPDGPTRVLLAVITHRPDVVMEVLRRYPA
jgi:putative transcriptional regulator